MTAYAFYGKQLYGEYSSITDAAADAPQGAFVYVTTGDWYFIEYGFSRISDLEDIPKDIRAMALLL